VTTIFVDADACPVRAEVETVATRRGVQVAMVCNGGIRPSPNALVRTVFVDDAADAADRWIADHAGPGDVVVTADIPLADACVKAGALVLRHDGSALSDANIGQVRATRDLMADLRGADPFRAGSGKGFSRADRARFLQALDRALDRAPGQTGKAAP